MANISGVDQHPCSGSTGTQDTSKDATSRDAVGERALQCHLPECHGEHFANKSELWRHEDKHKGPFTCHKSTCKKIFTLRHSLRRHIREAHRSAKYFCLVKKCERHTRGFGRKYNFIQHSRRVHNIRDLNVSETSDQAHHNGSDGEESLLDDEDDEIGPPKDMALSRLETLKQTLLGLRSKKVFHDMVGEKLSRDIETTEKELLDVILEMGG